jgi:hypothetical protein
MDKNWIKIYASGDFFKAELIRQALEENDIEVVLMNKKDSSYQFGEVQLLVPESAFAQATEIIIQNNLNA